MLLEQPSFWVSHLALGAAVERAAVQRCGQPNLARLRAWLPLLRSLLFLLLLRLDWGRRRLAALRRGVAQVARLALVLRVKVVRGRRDVELAGLRWKRLVEKVRGGQQRRPQRVQVQTRGGVLMQLLRTLESGRRFISLHSGMAHDSPPF